MDCCNREASHRVTQDDRTLSIIKWGRAIAIVACDYIADWMEFRIDYFSPSLCAGWITSLETRETSPKKAIWARRTIWRIKGEQGGWCSRRWWDEDHHQQTRHVSLLEPLSSLLHVWLFGCSIRSSRQAVEEEEKKTNTIKGFVSNGVTLIFSSYHPAHSLRPFLLLLLLLRLLPRLCTKGSSESGAWPSGMLSPFLHLTKGGISSSRGAIIIVSSQDQSAKLIRSNQPTVSDWFPFLEFLPNVDHFLPPLQKTKQNKTTTLP
jgi:hypothetical protein